MDAKNRIGLYVFTLGVLMLLARPYLVYKMTSARDMDPVRAFSLLQRLVKKKDDHHEESAMIASAVPQSAVAERPERKLLAALVICFLTPFKPAPRYAERLPLLDAFPRRHRYRLNNCLLI